MSVLLLAAFVCVSLAADIGRGIVSDCLDPAFEMRYSDMSNRAMLNFGVTILLDYRYTEKVTREQLQVRYAVSRARLVSGWVGKRVACVRVENGERARRTVAVAVAAGAGVRETKFFFSLLRFARAAPRAAPVFHAHLTPFTHSNLLYAL